MTMVGSTCVVEYLHSIRLIVLVCFTSDWMSV